MTDHEAIGRLVARYCHLLDDGRWDEFADLVHSKPEDSRFKLINAVAGQCLRSLKKLGMRNEIDRFLSRLHGEILRGATPAELRQRVYGSDLAPALFTAAERNVLAHLIDLERRGRVSREGESWKLAA